MARSACPARERFAKAPEHTGEKPRHKPRTAGVRGCTSTAKLQHTMCSYAEHTRAPRFCMPHRAYVEENPFAVVSQFLSPAHTLSPWQLGAVRHWAGAAARACSFRAAPLVGARIQTPRSTGSVWLAGRDKGLQ